MFRVPVPVLVLVSLLAAPGLAPPPALAPALAAPGLAAQEPPREGPLPREVEAAVMELANAPSTLRLPGGSRIPPGSRVEGAVVVLGGSLELGGRIDGALAVVNGDLTFRTGASVSGPVQVIGGRIHGIEEAELAGGAVAYRAPLHYRMREGRVEGVGAGGDVASRFLATDLGFGRVRFTLRAADAYNRAEGLPVEFGPVVEAAGRNPLVLEAFGIWRSVSGLNVETERMGYHFTLDQGVGGRGTMSVGAEAYSRVRAIEPRGLSDLESSLATFLLSRDYRDHYEAAGWSTYFDYRPIRAPARMRLAVREEEHGFVPVGGPWTLGRGTDDWRPEPEVAEGRATFVDAYLEWDSRDDPRHPADGWWMRARGVRQASGTLRSRLAATEGEEPGQIEYAPVTWGSLDLRRYARVSPSTRLQVRAMLAGRPTSRALPPQLQSTLGGEGSLPGHPAFSVACGTRDLVLPPPPGEPQRQALAGYGCDRVSLAQIELHHALPFVWDPGIEDWNGSEWAGLVRVQPEVVLFLNAGEGRAHRIEALGERGDSPGRGDVGVGLLTGSLGLYWAYPLNRKDRGLNFFVRLDHRF